MVTLIRGEVGYISQKNALKMTRKKMDSGVIAIQRVMHKGKAYSDCGNCSSHCFLHRCTIGLLCPTVSKGLTETVVPLDQVSERDRASPWTPVVPLDLLCHKRYIHEMTASHGCVVSTGLCYLLNQTSLVISAIVSHCD